MDDKKIEEVAKVYMIGEFYDRDEAEWNYPITNEEKRNQCIIDFKAGDTKDKKRLMNIEISSFCGLCGGAIHYYAKLYIKVSNMCGNSSVSGYLGGIEIPNDYQTIKGEFVRPLTQKEKDEQPDRWDDWYEVGDLVNAFESLEEIENLIKNLKKKFSSKEWKVEIRRNY